MRFFETEDSFVVCIEPNDLTLAIDLANKGAVVSHSGVGKVTRYFGGFFGGQCTLTEESALVNDHFSSGEKSDSIGTSRYRLPDLDKAGFESSADSFRSGVELLIEIFSMRLNETVLLLQDGRSVDLCVVHEVLLKRA